METIQQMEDKSVLVVFGCGELSIQLIKSLVMLRVKLITVLCLTKIQESEILQIIDSLGGKSTKIVSEVFDPSKQVCTLCTLHQACNLSCSGCDLPAGAVECS